MSEQPASERKPLGKVLLELSIIDEQQLEHALDYQKQHNIRLGQALIHLNFVTKKDIFRALAHQYHYPYVDIAEIDIAPAIIAELTADMVHHYQIIPIECNQEQNKMRLCMAPPFGLEVLNELETKLERQIEFVLTTPEQLQQTIARYYPLVEKEEEQNSVETPDAPEEQADAS